MLKMTFHKIKKLCSIALVPHILRDTITLSPNKLKKRPLDGFWKIAKSTDSKDRKAECEKCKKLIELVFGPEKPNSLLKQVEVNKEDMQMHEIQKVIAPSIAVNECNKQGSKRVLPKDNPKKELEHIEKEFADRNIKPLNNILQSTTAKTNEEQLAQKLEIIEEPGLVEAATPKIDGFNTSPKVLGGQENTSGDRSFLCTKIGPEENAIDKIAKKCLGSPPDKIDERILEEMKNCGMLGRGRKKPTSRSYYHATKSLEKETIVKTKSEQMPSNPLHDYPPIRYHKMKFAHKPQNISRVYFKNVPSSLIGDGHLERKTDGQKLTALEQKDEKALLADGKNILEKNEDTKLVSSDKTTVNGSYKNSSIVNDQACNNIELSEEVSTITNTTKEEKPKELVENVEVEEMLKNAEKTSRLEITPIIEKDLDFDHKHLKPDIIPCNQIPRTSEKSMEQNLLKTDKNEYLANVSNVKDSTEWYFGSDIAETSFNHPNTAISGASPYPQTEKNKIEREAKNDTAISAKQDPAEYYDLSHCKIGKLDDDYVISLSAVRSLAAYHQYSIITGTDEAKESPNVLFSTKDTSEVSPSEMEHSHHIENKELPTTINKDISATMGPLPHLKDTEEELSLTEMLRRVRERNRLEYCRACAYKALETEPAEASKCPPPLDKGKPIGPGTLGPGSCKPKPKPQCPPPPPTCPPSKPKDPCAKFTTCLIGDKIKETFSLVLQVSFKPVYVSPNLTYSISKMNAIEPLKHLLYNKNANRVEKMRSFLLSNCLARKIKESGNEDVILARDYEPWSPIPSWPIPKKEKKESFVCPKEGCKIIPPPRLNPPCKENPCLDFPKRTFSLIESEYEPLYLYDNEYDCL